MRQNPELDYTLSKVKASGRDFWLIAVIASDDTRFSRVVNRGRAGDPLEREKFDRDDARARGRPEDGFQQNALLIELATHRIMNIGDLGSLHRKIDDLINLTRTMAKDDPDHD